MMERLVQSAARVSCNPPPPFPLRPRLAHLQPNLDSFSTVCRTILHTVVLDFRVIFFFLLGKAARDVACCRDSAKLSRLCKLLNMWGRVRCKTCLTEVLEMHLSHFRRVSMQFLCRTNAFILPVSSPLWSQQQLLCNYSDRRSLNGPRILVMPRGFCSACCLCVCTQ